MHEDDGEDREEGAAAATSSRRLVADETERGEEEGRVGADLDDCEDGSRVISLIIMIADSNSRPAAIIAESPWTTARSDPTTEDEAEDGSAAECKRRENRDAEAEDEMTRSDRGERIRGAEASHEEESLSPFIEPSSSSFPPSYPSSLSSSPPPSLRPSSSSVRLDLRMIVSVATLERGPRARARAD